MLRSFFIFLLTAQMATAASYYVSLSGDNGNAGTIGSPFRTLAYADSIAVAGDTIFLAAGDYDEDINTVNGGTSGNPITIDGQGVATIRRITVDRPYRTLANLNIGNGNFATVNGQLVRLLTTSHFTTITNCVIDGYDVVDVVGLRIVSGNTDPFDTNTASDCVFVNNTLTRLKSSASSSIVAFDISGDRNLIQGNTITNVTSIDAFRVNGRTNIIERNLLTDLRGSARHPDVFQIVGLNGQASQGNIVRRNWIENGGGWTLATLEMDGNIDSVGFDFYNNVVVGIGIKFESSLPSTHIYNNIFYHVGTNGSTHAVILARDLGEGGGATNSIVKNNIFIDCGPAGSDTTGWYSFRDEWNETCEADYNYVSKGSFGAVSAGTVPVSDPAYNFQKFYEVNGINGGDPKMVNLSAHDFTLLSDSMLIDAGTAIDAFANDYLGMSRPQGAAWDIGPYEGGGPVLWFDFENDFATDGYIADGSGNGSHAQRLAPTTNFPSRVSSPVQGSYAGRFRPNYFDGFYTDTNYFSGQRAAITNLPAALTDTSKEMTIAAWFRQDTLPDGETYTTAKAFSSSILSFGWNRSGTPFLGRDNAGANGFMSIMVNTNGVSLNDAVKVNFPVPVGYSDTNWYHVAATLLLSTDGLTLTSKLYTNGVAYTTNTASLPVAIPTFDVADPAGATPPNAMISGWTHNQANLTLDPSRQPNTGWWNGDIDGLGVWLRVLSAGEIATLAGAPDGEVAGPSNPAAFRVNRINAGTINAQQILKGPTP
jgi:hypothetical protein